MNSMTCNILKKIEIILHTTSFLAGGQKGALKETVLIFAGLSYVSQETESA